MPNSPWLSLFNFPWYIFWKLYPVNKPLYSSNATVNHQPTAQNFEALRYRSWLNRDCTQVGEDIGEVRKDRNIAAQDTGRSSTSYRPPNLGPIHLNGPWRWWSMASDHSMPSE